MPAPVFATLNMKGGVGKTTISGNVARELYQAKQIPVLLIDLDPQFNLSQQLFERDVYDKYLTAGKHILRAFEPSPASDFFDINTSSTTPPPVSDVTVRVRHIITKPDIHLGVIPGSFDLTKFSLIPDPDKLAHAREYFRRFISDARKEYGAIFLDMNPSSSFLTLAGLEVATDILAPVRPDKYSVLGLELVRRLLEHPLLQNEPNLHVVMNLPSRSAVMTDTERQIRTHPYFGTRALVNRVYQSRLLAAKQEYTGFASDQSVPNRGKIKGDLGAVALELATRAGI